MTQCKRLVQYMTEEGGITAAEAAAELGIMYLSGRIKDLRRHGYNVEALPKSRRNRYGDLVHFHVYRIADYNPSLPLEV